MARRRKAPKAPDQEQNGATALEANRDAAQASATAASLARSSTLGRADLASAERSGAVSRDRLAGQLPLGNAHVQRIARQRRGDRGPKEDEAVGTKLPTGFEPADISPKPGATEDNNGDKSSEATASKKADEAKVENEDREAPEASAKEVADEAAEKVVDLIGGTIDRLLEAMKERGADEEQLERVEELARAITEYSGAVVRAFAQGLDAWAMTAVFSNIRVIGPVALGTPGCLSGAALVVPPAPATSPLFEPFAGPLAAATAAAAAVAFDRWMSGVTVPGLPWYPAFAAFPGAVAPPMPNVPFPLVGLPSAGAASMGAAKLTSAIDAAYGGPRDEDGVWHELIEATASGMSAAFTQWLGQKQVTNVLGQGQVPTFAPPAVVVGPVMGDTLPVPGVIH